MTPPDYLARLLDATDPESARALLLSSLAANIPIPRALAAALGIRQSGRAWAEAWRALGEAREMDAELREACEGVERRQDEQEKARLADRAQERADVSSDRVRGSTEAGGQDVLAVLGAGGSGVGRLAGDGAALSDGRSAESDGWLSDDRSEQGAGEVPAVGGVGSTRVASADLESGRQQLRDLPGGPHRDLRPSGRGRATGEEEAEGGGETGSGARSPADACGMPEVGASAIRDAGTLAVAPRLSLVEQMRAGGFVTEGRGRPIVISPPANDPNPLPPPPAYSKRASETTDDGQPDFSRLREEAAERAVGPMGWVLLQEELLARRNQENDLYFPALSDFSLHSIEGFFLSGKRWLLCMAGRGFGKSTWFGRIATALGFGIERRAAPGPAWVCPIVSVLPVDADRRLEDIQQILLHAYLQEAKIAQGKSMIAARDSGGNAIAWVSSASTIGNVSGPSSFAALVDEEEKILHGRAGGIVGSLAYTFRSRPHVYGFRVSSAMGMDGTLARACAKGNGPGAPLTNYVTTLGSFLDVAVDGCLAVAAWEEGRGHVDAAVAIRSHAASLTADSWQIPTWLGHPSIGRPTEDAPWGPGDAAIATRIEAEAVDEKSLDGLQPWRYWLRECASVPTGGEEVNAWDGDDTGCGEPSRYGSESEERGYE